MKHLFSNNYTFGPHIALDKVSTSDIIDEPQLFGADWEFASNNCGDITYAIMDSLLSWETYFKKHMSEVNLNIKIDTKVHTLDTALKFRNKFNPEKGREPRSYFWIIIRQSIIGLHHRKYRKLRSSSSSTNFS